MAEAKKKEVKKEVKKVAKSSKLKITKSNGRVILRNSSNVDDGVIKRYKAKGWKVEEA